MYDSKIVSCIWRNYGTLDIIRDFAPGTDSEERELEKTIRETRSAIEDFKRDLPPIIETALRQGFTATDVLKVILDKGEGLIPLWNAEVLVSGVVAKLDDEGRPAREAAEKTAREARLAAIQKRSADARQAILDSGLPC